MSKFSKEDIILDALADDMESITQIFDFLQRTELKGITMEQIKRLLIEMLQNNLIHIAYPPNSSIVDFIQTNNDTQLDYWFVRTQKGIEQWEKFSERFDKLENE